MASRILVFAFLTVTFAANGAAQDFAAPYQRVRTGAADWSQRGGYAGGAHHGGYAPYAGYGGYAAFGFAGSYYQRPYPYHFDYYRDRWAAPQTVAPECPCEPTPPLVEPTTDEPHW